MTARNIGSLNCRTTSRSKSPILKSFPWESRIPPGASSYTSGCTSQLAYKQDCRTSLTAGAVSRFIFTLPLIYDSSPTFIHGNPDQLVDSEQWQIELFCPVRPGVPSTNDRPHKRMDHTRQTDSLCITYGITEAHGSVGRSSPFSRATFQFLFTPLLCSSLSHLLPSEPCQESLLQRRWDCHFRYLRQPLSSKDKPLFNAHLSSLSWTTPLGLLLESYPEMSSPGIGLTVVEWLKLVYWPSIRSPLTHSQIMP